MGMQGRTPGAMGTMQYGQQVSISIVTMRKTCLLKLQCDLKCKVGLEFIFTQSFNPSSLLQSLSHLND